MMSYSGAVENRDMKALHQMWTASRRLCEVLNVFRFSFKRRHLKRLTKRLKPIVVALCAARDLDAFIRFLQSYRRKIPKEDRAALSHLQRYKELQRKEISASVRKQVKKLKRRKFIARVKQFVKMSMNGHPIPARRPEEIDLPAPDASLRAFGIPLLEPRVESLLSWLPQARVMGDSETLHNMRVRAKRLRYAMEPFEQVFCPDFRPLISDITALQELLGELYDCDTWVSMVEDFAGLTNGLNDTMKRLKEHLETRHSELLEELRQTWSPGSELDFRRRFFKVVGGRPARNIRRGDNRSIERKTGG